MPQPKPPSVPEPSWSTHFERHLIAWESPCKTATLPGPSGRGGGADLEGRAQVGVCLPLIKDGSHVSLHQQGGHGEPNLHPLLERTMRYPLDLLMVAYFLVNLAWPVDTCFLLLAPSLMVWWTLGCCMFMASLPNTVPLVGTILVYPTLSPTFYLFIFIFFLTAAQQKSRHGLLVRLGHCFCSFNTEVEHSEQGVPNIVKPVVTFELLRILGDTISAMVGNANNIMVTKKTEPSHKIQEP